jgi:hypothetical protein
VWTLLHSIKYPFLSLSLCAFILNCVCRSPHKKRSKVQVRFLILLHDSATAVASETHVVSVKDFRGPMIKSCLCKCVDLLARVGLSLSSSFLGAAKLQHQRTNTAPYFLVRLF